MAQGKQPFSTCSQASSFLQEERYSSPGGISQQSRLTKGS